MSFAVTTLSRRQLLHASIMLGSLGLGRSVRPVLAQTPLKKTPEHVLGPFYPVLRTVDRGTDLTAIAGKPGRAQGQVIHLMDRSLDLPLPAAQVESSGRAPSRSSS